LVINLSGRHVGFNLRFFFVCLVLSIVLFVLIAIFYQVVEIPFSSPFSEQFYHEWALNCVNAFSKSIE
jgi:hypothetical protein